MSLDTKDLVEQIAENGYAIIRKFIDPESILELQEQTKWLYSEGLKHYASFRHGNLSFEILPEKHFGKRYLIQAYWFAWMSKYFEEFRRRPEFLEVINPLLGDNSVIKKILYSRR